MDVYEQFRQVLDSHPSGAPASPAFARILRILFSEQEAALAAAMSFKPQTAAKIAADAGLEQEQAGRMLDALADRALIFCRDKDGQRVYSLLPTIPGLFEFPFMRGRNTPELEELAGLWREYHADGLGQAFCGDPTPPMRVVPVGRSIAPGLHVQPFEVVADMVRTADYIALADCACRVSMAGCQRPLDVCLIFGPAGKFLVERGFARRIDVAQGLNVLKRAEQAGLVHTSNNSADRANLICNCCPCCCTVLRGLTELHNPHAFASSAFLAASDPDKCTGCGLCADERCPMDAIELKDEAAQVKPERCIGCGLCVSTCPSGAMHLLERPQRPQICESVAQMGLQMVQEKGKLEAFMKVMQR